MRHVVIDRKFLYGDQIILTGEEYHYLKNVRRFKTGDYIKALVEDEIMVLYINEIKRDKIILKIIDKNKIKDSIKPEISIFQSVIKSKKIDLLVSRVSEIGVKDFYPIITERSILTGNIGKNKVDRWKRLSKEGSKISGLKRVLKIHPPQKLEELDNIKLNDFDIKLLFSTDAGSEHIKLYLESINDPLNKSFCLFFGPEGGISEKEEIYLQNLGFIKINMGSFTMRSETAAIAAATFIRIFYSCELNQE